MQIGCCSNCPECNFKGNSFPQKYRKIFYEIIWKKFNNRIYFLYFIHYLFLYFAYYFLELGSVWWTVFSVFGRVKYNQACKKSYKISCLSEFVKCKPHIYTRMARNSRLKIAVCRLISESIFYLYNISTF